MSKFSLTVDAMGLARQIAALVYSGGQLRMKLTPHMILNSGIKYIIELVGDRIIGVIGYELVRDNVAELKHLSVHPSYRRQGLGNKLLTKAIAAAPAEYLFGLIRSNNVASLNNARSLGLVPVGTKKAYGNYHLIVVAKKKTLGRSMS
jgi:ribosomal protein S18 acetylase RimI-like enzyme